MKGFDLMLCEGRPLTIEDGSLDNRLVTDEPVLVVAAVLEWIARYVYPSDVPMGPYGSIEMNRILVEDTGILLTNNQFKDAMFLCGYDACDENAFNWKFYISTLSPAFNEELRGKRGIAISVRDLQESPAS